MKVFRIGEEAIALQNNDLLTLPELVPAWSVNVAALWSPVFDEDEDETNDRNSQ